MGDILSAESFSEDEDSEWTDVSDDEDAETEATQKDTSPDETTPEESSSTDGHIDADNTDQPIAVGVRHLWEEDQLIDYTLQCEDRDFQVHRVILAACSNFFREVLSEDLVGDSFRIEGMRAVVVEKLIKFIYTSKLQVNSENVAEILNGANFLQIESAEDICNQFIDKKAHGFFTPVVAHPLRSGIQSIWENDQLLDYTIHVEDEEFQVHKVVLAAMSDYFRVMMTGGLTETGKDSVKIEGVSTGTVEALLDIIYTNSFVTDDVTEILGGAVYFQIQSAIKICSQFMIGQLDLNNWLEILEVFRSFGLMDSVKEVQGYITSNIREIVRESVFRQSELQYQDLNFFIDNWKGSEHELFQFVKKWVKADVKNRRQHEDKLLCCVRFGLMTPAELASVKLQEVVNASVKAPKPWYGFLDNAIEYHKLPLHERVVVQSEQTQVRSPTTFVIFPPEGSDKAGCVFESKEAGFLLQHSITSPKWEMTLTEIEVNNFLIVLLHACRKSFPWRIFDPRTLQWAPIASVPADLCATSLTHDNKYMYASGGETEDEHIVDRIDRYDFKTNKWSPFSKLPVPVRSHSTCVVDNGLYVSGGFPEDFVPDLLNVFEYNDACLSRMDRLDLTTLKWEKKAPMLDNRFDHRMHSMKIEGEEVVCIVGHELDMEYYSPSKNQWFSCSFSFNEPPPNPAYRPFFRGNSVYLLDACIEEGPSKGLSACAVVTYPEQGKEAHIDYLQKYRGLFGFFTRSSVLALRPHTQRVLKTPVPKTTKGNRVEVKK